LYKQLSFPYREEDQLSIREMIKALAELMEEQILSLRDLKKAMVSEMQILPKLSDTKVNMTVDDTIALDQLVEKSLNQSIDTFAIILEDLKNLKHASDMTTVLANF
jgi:Cdc6-like AAA superfamily ATPase